MKSQSDRGTADAEQSASEEGEDNVGAQPQTGSLLGSQDELLNLAKGMGHSIGDSVTPESESKDDEEEEVEETESEEVAGEAEVEAESETEDEESEEEEEVAAEKKQGEQWPQSAKARVAKETRLKNERTAERDKAAQLAQQWRDRATALEAQLQETNGARPGGDPLANVFSVQGLNMKKAEAEHYSAWAERNRNGGEVPIFGKKDKDGSPVTKYLDEEGVTNLKLGCDKVLRDGIPTRGAYLQQYEEYNQQAVEIYPELSDGNSTLYKEGKEIMSALQRGFIPPDAWIWIGHALYGRNKYLERNGSGENDATRKIVKSAKTKVAPTATKTRGFVPRSGRADLGKAEAELKTKGDADSAEKWLEAKGVGGGAKSKRVELVES